MQPKMDWKSEQEWIIIRYFREHYPEFPAGRITKGESPDFRLWTSPKRFIGIEITQVHPPSPSTTGLAVLDKKKAYQQIISTIAAKEEKISLYRKGRPSGLWLIIYTDFVEPGAGAKIESIPRLNGHPKGFDRVFLFNLDKHQVTELLYLPLKG